MTATVAKVRASLHKALEKLGTVNGHACPPSRSNHDPLLHEGLVAAEIRRYGEKLYDAWKEKLHASGLTTKLPEPGSSEIITAGEVYGLTITVNKPAQRFDPALCKNALNKLVGKKLTTELIEQVLLDSVKESKPATKIEVSAVS